MTPDDFRDFADFLRKNSGISLGEDKEYLVEARMAPVMEEWNFTSISGLCAALRDTGDPELEAQVVDYMTTNETSFFRDNRPFEALEHFVLPALIDSRGSDKRISIWSAACSFGQEPYSIAMILHEKFPSLADWNVTITATDISKRAIARASAGSYSELEINRGLPPDLRDKYFTRSGYRWEIDGRLRDSVEFRPLNMIDPSMPFPPADIIFVRNILYYFEVDLQKQVLTRIRAAMAPSSYLFLGSADTIANTGTEFERLDDFPRSGCFRVGGN